MKFQTLAVAAVVAFGAFAPANASGLLGIVGVNTKTAPIVVSPQVGVQTGNILAGGILSGNSILSGNGTSLLSGNSVETNVDASKEQAPAKKKRRY